MLKAGGPLVVLESMKMEMKISVPDELDGKKVKSLPCSAELKGSIGEGPNQTDYSDQSSVRILAKFRNFARKLKKFGKI